MPSIRLLRLGTRATLFALVSAAVALLWASPAAAGFPPAGSDDFTVSGSVNITSRLGQETISLSGTATINRGSPYIQGGVEVVDTEIVSMNLTGMSLTGPVTVIESPSRASTGQMRALQVDSSFPASSFFDVFVEATIPASCYNCPPTVTKYNTTALHMTQASVALYYWPPASATYQMQVGTPATPTPGATPMGGAPDCTNGVSLLPRLTEYLCVTSASFTLTGPPSATGVGGVAELSGIEPAATNASARDGSGLIANAVAIIAIAAATFVLGGALWWRARRSSH